MRKQRYAVFQAPQTGSISMLSVRPLARGDPESEDALSDREPGDQGCPAVCVKSKLTILLEYGIIQIGKT